MILFLPPLPRESARHACGDLLEVPPWAANAVLQESRAQNAKTFLSKSDMSKHLEIDIGERPHTCALYDKAFSQVSHLKSHVMKYNGV